VPQAWLQRARANLQLGWAALSTQGVMPEDACFHAQQCAEKALKALLLHLEIAFPKTHAIEVYYSTCSKHAA
jgi:HEPN domain-containing protein